MNAHTVKVTFLMGCVELGKPTNRWTQDPDGYWSQEYTPTRWLREDGSIEREVPTECYIRIGCDADDIRRMGGFIVSQLPQPEPWWKFWRRAA